jgi:hypothetical protein
MGCNSAWRRLGAGHYESTDGAWSVRCWRRQEWWAFRAGALWGRWKPGSGWRRYIPFRTKRAAVTSVEEHGREW